MLIKKESRGGKIFSKNKTLPDLYLITCILVIVCFGCVMVYSASAYSAELNYGSSIFFLRKQIIGAIIGFLVSLFFYFYSYEKLRKFKYISIIISVILLLMVFLPGIGVESYGAKRWINLGITTLQPSELAKMSFILYSSSVMSDITHKIKTFKGIIPILFTGCIFCFLIIMEPNMSITMCMALLMCAMLFIGGARIKHFLYLLIPAIILIPVLILLEPYRLRRLVAFLDPFASASGEGFQLVQSLYSIGAGNWFGVGLFNSRQKYLFLPFSESDFIFSIIVEETGLIGAICLLLVYLVFVIRGLSIAKHAKDRFGSYMASGITCLIAIQVLLNVAVVTGLIPPTGLPLPFISAGSTALVCNMAMVGILLNIDRESRKNMIQ